MQCSVVAGYIVTSVQIELFIHALDPIQTANITVVINKALLFMRLQEPLESNVLTMYNSSTYVEDAVWTLAHAVNNCISSTDSVGMCSRNISRYIEDFSTDKACQSNIIIIMCL